MKVSVKDSFGGGVSIEPLEKFIADCLDGADYDRGKFEAVEETARRNSEALGRLIVALLRRGALKPEDVTEIIHTLADEVNVLPEVGRSTR